jgi:RNA polymerase-binding transcription factor DksA
MALTAEQREALRGILERERRKLVRRLRRFGEAVEERSSTGLSQHMAEAAADMTERETAALMASEEGRRLVEVNRALDRLARAPDRFDVCRSCGEEIAYARLEAIPYAELCIECQRREEGGGG